MASSTFVEHRHDQSVLSVLCKLEGAPYVEDNINAGAVGSWDQVSHLPFLGARVTCGSYEETAWGSEEEHAAPG